MQPNTVSSSSALICPPWAPPSRVVSLFRAPHQDDKDEARDTWALLYPLCLKRNHNGSSVITKVSCMPCSKAAPASFALGPAKSKSKPKASLVRKLRISHIASFFPGHENCPTWNGKNTSISLGPIVKLFPCSRVPLITEPPVINSSFVPPSQRSGRKTSGSGK